MVLLAWLRHVGYMAPVGGANPRWLRRNVTSVLEELSHRNARRRPR